MMKAPILNKSFIWIPASTHQADSTLFRERQKARILAAEAARVMSTNVAPIRKGKKA